MSCTKIYPNPPEPQNYSHLFAFPLVVQVGDNFQDHNGDGTDIVAICVVVRLEEDDEDEEGGIEIDVEVEVEQTVGVLVGDDVVRVGN